MYAVRLFTFTRVIVDVHIGSPSLTKPTEPQPAAKAKIPLVMRSSQLMFST